MSDHPLIRKLKDPATQQRMLAAQDSGGVMNKHSNKDTTLKLPTNVDLREPGQKSPFDAAEVMAERVRDRREDRAELILSPFNLAVEAATQAHATEYLDLHARYLQLQAENESLRKLLDDLHDPA